MSLAMEIQQVVNIRKRLTEQFSRALNHFVVRLYLRAYIISRDIFLFCVCVWTPIFHVVMRAINMAFPTCNVMTPKTF